MRRFLMTLMIVAGLMHAGEFEQQTLIGDDFESGGFGGFGFSGGNFNGTTALMSGGKGGWIINHQFYIGGEGHGLVYPLSNNLGLGYGGLLLGAELLPADYIVHLAVELMAGAGGISNSSTNEAGSFPVGTASANLILNVSKHFHVSAGATYRYANITGISSLSSTALNGMSYDISFLFGSF